MRLALGFLLLFTLRQDDPLEAELEKIRPRPEEERWRQIPWMGSLKKAFEKGTKEGKPVFYFGADGVLDTGNC